MRHRGASLLLLACACTPDCADTRGSYTSDSKRWVLWADALATDPCDVPGDPDPALQEPLLVGTRWCPAIECLPETQCSDARAHAPDPEVASFLDCHTPAVDGPAMVDGECLVLTGPGAVTWRFEPRPCPAIDAGEVFLPERVALVAVAAADLRGALIPYLDREARQHLVSGTGEELRAPSPAPGAPIHLLADAKVRLAINLRTAAERRVAWPKEQATIAVEAVAGAAPTAEIQPDSTVVVTAPAGSEATLSLRIAGEDIELGRVLGVAADQLRDLEIEVAYNPLDEAGSRAPFGARAVVRDGDGTIVYGAAPTWTVLAGRFPLYGDLHGDGSNLDYLGLADGDADPEETSTVCYGSPGSGSRSYTGTIAASVADLHAEADLAWTITADAGDLGGAAASLFGRDDLPESPRCEGPGFPAISGCGCASGPPGPDALAGLALLVLGTRRRRRNAVT